MSSDVVGEMGAGNFSNIELDKALAGKVANVWSFIGELSEGVRGSASPKDLETMFQLLYLRFIGARRDDEAFQAYMARTEGWLENQEASPEFQFSSKFSETMSMDHPRRRWLTMERLKQLELEKALAFYRDRFADASDFLFTLVGNFEVESIRPFVETWIGGLPAAGREESWRDVGLQSPEGVVTFVILLFMFIISFVSQQEGSFIFSIAKYLSVAEHIRNMLRGLIDTRDLTYFLSIIVLFLFLTKRSMESLLWKWR